MATSFASKALAKVGLQLERRSSLENPQTPLSYPAEWLLDIFNGGRTDSGLRVSEMTAIQVAAVFACVQIIANAIASHPLNIYRREMVDGNSSKTVAYGHPLFDLLAHEPNIEMTSTTWRRTMMCHKLLWGNHYSEIERDENGQIIGLWPRNPARTRPVRITEPMTMQGTKYPTGTLVYETYETIGDSQIMEQDNATEKFGMRRIILAEDMLHVMGLSLDGRLAQDVVILARQAIGLALATEKFGAKFFGNGAIPQGILGVPGDMSDVQWEVLKRSWAESHGGENQHKTGVLPPGVTYTKTGSNPNEAQNVETRSFQIAEIARFFNVPLHMLGIMSDSQGKSTVEQSSIEFKLYCVDPHAVDLEQELKRKIFPKIGQGANKYVAHLDLRKLMYPDAASRATIYGSGKQWGFFCTDDIRELEGMNPVTDGSGKVFWMPNNMMDASLSSVQSKQVAKGLNDGTLAATPTGVTPIGDHPVVKAANEAAQQNRDAALAQAKASASDGEDDDTPDSRSVRLARTRKMFGPMYRDAVGRAAARVKATPGDYVKIFAPLTSAVIDCMLDGQALNAADFTQRYVGEMFAKRSDKWGTDLDAAATEEFTNLLAAIARSIQLEA
jgi:HK97 family phage portal protein